ncbi:MAG: tRNA (adenosine(37)-N6)-threonylcarbamoyltransferase complex ATPase subunit type 1 TsaE [Gammaproteobacteria bacterium]
MAESLAAPESGSASLRLPEPATTAALGLSLARALLTVAPARLVVHLEGELGAGKTSLVRALLAGLGHEGRVPSPTYTLVEPYALDRFRVLHVDLYRLRDPAELDDLGLLDELDLADDEGRGRLLLAEWPDRGGHRLPGADLCVQLAIEGNGRTARVLVATPAGFPVLQALLGNLEKGV